MTTNFQRWQQCVLLAIVMLLSACGSPPEAPEIIRPVRLATLNENQALPQMVLSGEVRARVESRLGFRVPGKIEARLVELGQAVKKGDTLARLEPSGEQLGVRAAEARLASAKAEQSLAKSELKRIAELNKKGFVSPTEYERYKITVENANAAVQQAQADVNLSRNQLDYTHLKADQDGIVVAVLADVGEVVPAGQPVLHIAQQGELEVLTHIPEDKLQIAKDAEATLSVYTHPEQKFTGELRELSRSADPITRMYEARYRIIEPAEFVTLGQTATVQLHLKQDTQGLVVPMTALVNHNQQHSVWVFDPDTQQVTATAVEVLGFTQGSALIAGVEAGTQVVTAGVHVLTEGQTVRPMVEE